MFPLDPNHKLLVQVGNGISLLNAQLMKLDADLLDCITGLCLCFFGGTFIALVSAWEVCLCV
jgi:hypothetical protein